MSKGAKKSFKKLDKLISQLRDINKNYDVSRTLSKVELERAEKASKIGK